MADEDWTVPKPLGTDYTDPYQRDHDRITVTRGYVMWLMRESARLGRQVQVVELQNIELKTQSERSTNQYSGIIDHQLAVIEGKQAEIDRLNAELFTCSCANDNMNKHMNENARLKAEVASLKSLCDNLGMGGKHTVTAIVEEYEKLKAEVERLKEIIRREVDGGVDLREESQRTVEENHNLRAEVERLKADNEQLQNRCDFMEGRQS